jgi:hypothetical protein
MKLKDLHEIARHFNVGINVSDNQREPLKVFCYDGVDWVYGYRPKIEPVALLEMMREYCKDKPFPRDTVLPNGLVVSELRHCPDPDLIKERQEDKQRRDCYRRDRRDGIPPRDSYE